MYIYMYFLNTKMAQVVDIFGEKNQFIVHDNSKVTNDDARSHCIGNNRSELSWISRFQYDKCWHHGTA